VRLGKTGRQFGRISRKSSFGKSYLSGAGVAATEEEVDFGVTKFMTKLLRIEKSAFKGE
jgi:hypothetical protein